MSSNSLVFSLLFGVYTKSPPASLCVLPNIDVAIAFLFLSVFISPIIWSSISLKYLNLIAISLYKDMVLNKSVLTSSSISLVKYLGIMFIGWPVIGSNLPNPTSPSSIEMLLRNCSPTDIFPPNTIFSNMPFLTKGRNVLVSPLLMYPSSEYSLFFCIM